VRVGATTSGKPAWTSWAPAAVTVLGAFLAVAAWVFTLAADVRDNRRRVEAVEHLGELTARVAVAESRLAAIEADRHNDASAVLRRMMRSATPPGVGAAGDQ